MKEGAGPFDYPRRGKERRGDSICTTGLTISTTNMFSIDVEGKKNVCPVCLYALDTFAENDSNKCVYVQLFHVHVCTEI